MGSICPGSGELELRPGFYASNESPGAVFEPLRRVSGTLRSRSRLGCTYGWRRCPGVSLET